MKFNKKANLFILIFFTIYITILLVLFFRFESVKTGDNNYFVHDNIELIDALNKEVTSIVKMLELYDKNIRSKIFLTANFVEYALFAPANWRSFGATYPFPNLIIIAPSSVDKNMVFRNGKENNIRKLSSTIAHEIIHVLINNKYGIIRSRFLPKWKVEGYADYIANESSFDEKLGLEYFAQKKKMIALLINISNIENISAI